MRTLPEVLVLISIWGTHTKGHDKTRTIRDIFSQLLGILRPQDTVKQRKTQQ